MHSRCEAHLGCKTEKLISEDIAESHRIWMQLKEDIFVEPAVGVCHKVDVADSYRLDALWNAESFLAFAGPEGSLSKEDLNLEDTEKWRAFVPGRGISEQKCQAGVLWPVFYF